MFSNLFGNRQKSKDRLKDRLKLVLSYDRANLTPGKMEELKTELMEVIRKYFPASQDDYDVKLERQGEHMVFMAHLPVDESTITPD